MKRFLSRLARLEHLRIEIRLQLAFACVLVLMFIGSAISLWQFQRVRNRVANGAAAQHQRAAVLRVNNSLLTLMGRLHRAADSGNAKLFEVQAENLLRTFESDTAVAKGVLHEITPASGRDKFVIDSLSEMVDSEHRRVAKLIELARDGDWMVLHARLADQVDHTDDIAEFLMREADANLSQAQARLLDETQHAEGEARRSLIVSGLLSTLAAAMLGVLVTRSIVKPLSALGLAARALARGDFDHQIGATGNDELANLAATFDSTARELRRKEDQLQQLLVSEKQARTTAQLLNEVGRTLSAELDQERLIRSLTEFAAKLIAADVGAFFFEEHVEGQTRAFFSGPDGSRAGRLGLLRGTRFWPTSGKAVRSDNISEENEYRATFNLPDQHAAEPVRSFLAAPVLSRSRQQFGVLVFCHSEAGVFSDRDVEVVMGICAQAAIALENARLFEQVNVSNQALEESNEALRRANDDLSVFAYSASHDLQEPLRNISIYSQMLQRRYEGHLGSEGNAFLGFLIQSAARMSELVSDLLSYLQVSGADTNYPLLASAEAAVCKALVNLHQAVSSTNATVTYTNLPQVAVQPVYLQQLFQNLIGNAIKYRSNEAPRIQISAEPVGKWWRFSVEDNGIGFSPEYAASVFRLFKRLHRQDEYPGTGVGLAICQKIVERHGGTIWVESEVGTGCNFRFTLPAADRTADARPS